MGDNIQAVGTIFRDSIGGMGNFNNDKTEIMGLPTSNTHHVRNIHGNSMFNNVLSVFKKDMATVKIGWILTNIFGVPMTFLTLFSKFLNIQMEQPYKNVVAILSILYLIVIIVRACIKAWVEGTAAKERDWEFKVKKDDYEKAKNPEKNNGTVKSMNPKNRKI